MSVENDAKAKAAGRALVNALEVFRAFNKDMQAGQIVLFLKIALEPGQTIFEYSKVVGMGRGGTASRNVEAMMSVKRVENRQTKQMKEVPGLGLVEAYQDINDLRAKRLRLTPKGKRVFDTLVELLTKKGVSDGST